MAQILLSNIGEGEYLSLVQTLILEALAARKAGHGKIFGDTLKAMQASNNADGTITLTDGDVASPAFWSNASWDQTSSKFVKGIGEMVKVFQDTKKARSCASDAHNSECGEISGESKQGSKFMEVEVLRLTPKARSNFQIKPLVTLGKNNYRDTMDLDEGLKKFRDGITWRTRASTPTSTKIQTVPRFEAKEHGSFQHTTSYRDCPNKKDLEAAARFVEELIEQLFQSQAETQLLEIEKKDLTEQLEYKQLALTNLTIKCREYKEDGKPLNNSGIAGRKRFIQCVIRAPNEPRLFKYDQATIDLGNDYAHRGMEVLDHKLLKLGLLSKVEADFLPILYSTELGPAMTHFPSIMVTKMTNNSATVRHMSIPSNNVDRQAFERLCGEIVTIHKHYLQQFKRGDRWFLDRSHAAFDSDSQVKKLMLNMDNNIVKKLINTFKR